jgi:hypothetical protein
MKRPIRVAALLPFGFALIAASQALAITTHLFAECLSASQPYLLPDDVAGQGLDITLGGDLFATGMATFAVDYSEIEAELFETDGRYDVDSSPSDSPRMQ